MAQKIQFVVTIIHDPKLLIFDEPFSGFDPINAASIRKDNKEKTKTFDSDHGEAGEVLDNKPEEDIEAIVFGLIVGGIGFYIRFLRKSKRV